MQCPACHAELVAASTPHGGVERCTQCSGVLIHLSELRTRTAECVVDELWGTALNSPPSLGRHCPRCARPFRVCDVRYGRWEAAFELDTCTVCEWFWFDATELQRIPIEQKTQSGQVEPIYVVLEALLWILFLF